MKALVSRESVFKAADELHDAGEKPSVRKIMGVLGGGSPNTISPLLAEWKGGHAPGEAAPVKPSEKLMASIAQEIQEAVNAATEALNDQVAELRQENDLLIDSGRAAELESARLAELVELGNAENQILQGKLEGQNAELRAAKAESTEQIKQARDEAQAERKRAENALTELAKAGVTAEMSQKAAAESQAVADALRVELETVRAAFADEKQRAAVLASESAALVAAARQHKADIEKREAEISALQAEGKAQNARVVELTEKHLNAVNENRKLRAEVTALKKGQQAAKKPAEGAKK